MVLAGLFGGFFVLFVTGLVEARHGKDVIESVVTATLSLVVLIALVWVYIQ